MAVDRAHCFRDVRIPPNVGFPICAVLQVRRGQPGGAFISGRVVSRFPLPLRERDRVRGAFALFTVCISYWPGVARQLLTFSWAAKRK